MRRIFQVTTLLAIAALAACATDPGPAGPGAAGAPALIAGLDWHGVQAAGAAKLAYGPAESDAIYLFAECETGSDRLSLYAPDVDGAAELHLESGGETERYRATALPASEVSDGEITAEASAADPVFQRFRRLGWIARWVAGERQVYAAHPGSAGRVESFFAACAPAAR